MAFRICSRSAMKQAIARADAVLLEPIMNIEVETPTEYQGAVIGDLSSRRGVIKRSETRDDLTVIEVSAPFLKCLVTLLAYALLPLEKLVILWNLKNTQLFLLACKQKL